MKKRLFLAGMFSMVLAFGLAVTGCDDGSGDDGGGGGGASLEGTTWAKGDNKAIRFTGGTLQYSEHIKDSAFASEGTYTYDSALRITVTLEVDGEVKTLPGNAAINGTTLNITGFADPLDKLNGSWTKQ
jgi:hypothetical protein